MANYSCKALFNSNTFLFWFALINLGVAFGLTYLILHHEERHPGEKVPTWEIAFAALSSACGGSALFGYAYKRCGPFEDEAGERIPLRSVINA